MHKPLEEVLGHHFRNPELLKEALSHKSYASETQSGVCNERLEFLGDSILAAVVAHQLYDDYPLEDEGRLSKKKSQLVSRPSLAHWAADLNLGAYLYLGIGEESSGGRARQSLLANAIEAIIGALYLDGGYQAVARFIRQWCAGRHAHLKETDYKSRLQEVLQKKHKVPPSYEMIHAVGPDHDKTFQIVVHMGKRILGRGSGKSKKDAEQSAACNALEQMHLGEN
ncbi:MAG: ribonuclease III [Elusimicrobia bacterium]|nr:ribonuclease III [Elusimicrobiota bacterium]